jgi:hypothetical protein
LHVLHGLARYKRNTVLYRNHIALRSGDNYPTPDVSGKVCAEHCDALAAGADSALHEQQGHEYHPNEVRHEA